MNTTKIDFENWFDLNIKNDSINKDHLLMAWNAATEIAQSKIDVIDLEATRNADLNNRQAKRIAQLESMQDDGRREELITDTVEKLKQANAILIAGMKMLMEDECFSIGEEEFNYLTALIAKSEKICKKDQVKM